MSRSKRHSSFPYGAVGNIRLSKIKTKVIQAPTKKQSENDTDNVKLREQQLIELSHIALERYNAKHGGIL